MSNTTRLAALVLMAGLAAPAMAQDSTSKNSDAGNGLPGDALDAFSTVQQRKSYVATLSPIVTSQGTTFGIVPLIKGSKACTAFFNNLLSAQGISQTMLNDIDVSGHNYLTWSSPQQGIHPTENATGASLIAGPALSKQFGVVFNEGAGSTTCQPTVESQDNVITGLVNFDPAFPSKLYVERITAAVNKTSNAAGTLCTGSMGIGAVDANGNTVIRCDNFGSSASATNRFSGNNYLRVRSAARNGAAINTLSSLGGTNVTDFLLNNNATTHSTATLIPQDLAGRSVLLGSNFNKQYVYESAVNTLTSNLTELGTLADIRGGMGFSPHILFANSVGTAVNLGKTSSAGTAPSDSINLLGVDANGVIVGQRVLTYPAAISDGCDSFTATGWEFDGYHSQTNAQGGNGVAAVGVDQAGRALAACTMYNQTAWNNYIISQLGAVSSVWDNANPYNAIGVARFDPTSPTSPVTWKLAAWVDFDTVTLSSTGKPILDNTGTPIGRLCSFWDIHQDPSRQYQYGPDMSQPVFDSAGNIWFLSFVELYNRLPGGGSDFDAALVRAVYDPDSFCYTLDKVLELGQKIQGSDSSVNYQINFLDIPDGDGRLGSPGDPSISSGSLFSNNGMEAAWANSTTGGLPPIYPQNLGGLVLAAKIIYDVNNDGLYQDPTGTVTTSTDEAYNVLLYVGNIKPCPADVTGDGVIDLNDFFQFFNDFDTTSLGADINGDLNVDLADFFQFLNSFDNNC